MLSEKLSKIYLKKFLETRTPLKSIRIKIILIVLGESKRKESWLFLWFKPRLLFMKRMIQRMVLK